MERSRYKGTADELCNAIMPAATNKSFVKFKCEVEDITKVTVDKDMPNIISYHSVLLGAIHDLQPNLSIPGQTMEKALKLVLEAKADEWDMAEQYHAHWLKTIKIRLRNLLRVVAQGVVKKKGWAVHLPWAATPGDSPTRDADSADHFFSASTPSSTRPSGHRSVR